jgi:hypothetical protein
MPETATWLVGREKPDHLLNPDAVLHIYKLVTLERGASQASPGGGEALRFLQMRARAFSAMRHGV